jgi:hypothetical protein
MSSPHATPRRRARPIPRPSIFGALALALLGAPAAGAQVVTAASGANAAAIQGSVDTYRASLGTLNANVAGSFGSGRREINWDGVPDVQSSPNAFAPNFFNVNSPRGAVFSTPGTGFQTSASLASGVPVEFGNINPTYSETFGVFSAQRLFTPIGSNVTDVQFFVPGSTTAALTRGFGAVFTDVDLANTTSMSFFGAGGGSLGTFFVPVGGTAAAGGSLSFLGVLFADAVISRVRITTGNAALGAGVNDLNGNPTDLVVMDDFIYGEPVSTVPEPATVLLLGGGLVALGAGARIRRRA